MVARSSVCMKRPHAAGLSNVRSRATMVGPPNEAESHRMIESVAVTVTPISLPLPVVLHQLEVVERLRGDVPQETGDRLRDPIRPPWLLAHPHPERPRDREREVLFVPEPHHPHHQ